MEAQAPRDLSGKRDNPLGQLLQNAELGWTITRGPLALAGRPEGLTVVDAAQRHVPPHRPDRRAAARSAISPARSAGCLASSSASRCGSLTGRVLDQRADVRGNVMLNVAARDHCRTGGWSPISPAQANIGDATSFGRGREAQFVARGEAAARPRGRRAGGRAAGAASATIRSSSRRRGASGPRCAARFRSARRRAGVPDLWLEVRPVRAVAAQPRIDAAAVTLTVGVQAETRITPAESKPDCPFPATSRSCRRWSRAASRSAFRSTCRSPR